MGPSDGESRKGIAVGHQGNNVRTTRRNGQWATRMMQQTELAERERQRIRRAVDSVEQQLMQMRAELEDMSLRVQAGEFGALRDTTKVASDIRAWIRLAMETETQIVERQKTAANSGASSGAGAGPGGTAAIDLAAVRHQIGCRLDRLRRCGDAGGVSGKPE